MDQILKPIRFSKPIRIDNQNEILKLKLNNEDRFLIKNQDPVAAIWRGNNESSCFYAWISASSKNIIDPQELKRMDHYLQDKIDQNKKLEDIVAPLLGILESGLYQLYYHEPYINRKHDSCNNFWKEPCFNDRKSIVWIDGTIVFTQDISALNLERVEYYKKSIQAGKRPTIITIALAELGFHTKQRYLEKIKENEFASYLAIEYGSECIYPQLIIDGHHKAKAYIELNQKPSILNITKLHLKEEFENNKWNYQQVKQIIENNIGEEL